jgi:hypothetical protein
MRADRDQSYAQTEDSAPERLGSRGGRKSSERARCHAANRSQPYREAVSFNVRFLCSRVDFRATFARHWPARSLNALISIIEFPSRISSIAVKTIREG